MAVLKSPAKWSKVRRKADTWHKGTDVEASMHMPEVIFPHMGGKNVWKNVNRQKTLKESDHLKTDNLVLFQIYKTESLG